MMFIRIYIIQEAYSFLAKPLAIALRYSAYRKQFKTNEDGTERTILDYQNQQYRLIPFLASAYAYFFVYRKTKALFSETQAQVKQGDMSGLGALHRHLSALKPFMTWNVLKGCEECRQVCGGYGYIDFSGLTQEVGDYAARCTYEGQNGLMTQVVGRGLLKQLQNALTGKKVDQNAKYLVQLNQLLTLKCKITTEKDWTVESIYQALKVRAASAVSQLGNRVQELMEDNNTPMKIFSQLIQSDLMNMSKLHTEFMIFDAFRYGLEEALSEKQLKIKTLLYLRCLLKIYGLKCLTESLAPLFANGYLAPSQVGTVEKALKLEIASIRNVAVGLIEAMAPPDEFIFSAIGSKTQDPYKTVLDWARKYNPLNAGDIRPGFEKYILPLMQPKL